MISNNHSVNCPKQKLNLHDTTSGDLDEMLQNAASQPGLL